MPRFSVQSNNRLMTCDQRLVLVFEEVISIVDCTVLCGARSKEAQNEAYRTGHSKVQWPESKHNVAEAFPATHSPTDEEVVAVQALPNLSEAIDVAPCPIKWNDRRTFDHFAGVVRAVAHELEIPIRWGGAWKQNWSNFHAHYELGKYE
jgi:peptidoglycan L-alanyl-D-glutamate endopeptidase CwlK